MDTRYRMIVKQNLVVPLAIWPWRRKPSKQYNSIQTPKQKFVTHDICSVSLQYLGGGGVIISYSLTKRMCFRFENVEVKDSDLYRISNSSSSVLFKKCIVIYSSVCKCRCIGRRHT